MTVQDRNHPSLRTATARPEMTAELMARTGLDEAKLDRLVRLFYARVREDALLAPVFDEAIQDWEPHLEKMVDFWSSVMLMTGRYHGRPMQKHLPLPIESAHFDRWLVLFRDTAREVCPPRGAANVIAAAERIAMTMQANREYHRKARGGVASPIS